MEKPIIISSHDVYLDTEYDLWVEDLKRTYRSAQSNAAIRTNFEKLKW